MGALTASLRASKVGEWVARAPHVRAILNLSSKFLILSSFESARIYSLIQWSNLITNTCAYITRAGDKVFWEWARDHETNSWAFEPRVGARGLLLTITRLYCFYFFQNKKSWNPFYFMLLGIFYWNKKIYIWPPPINAMRS